MAKVSLADHMKEQRSVPNDEPENCGPYITISRQFGCHGFSLGLLLMEILNDQAGEDGATWKIYHREILEKLANETNLATEYIEQQRRAKPRWIVDFFRSMSKERMPSGHEIRNRITTIIRGLALEGHAIIIGQGSSWATSDLPNGLRVRLEAPTEWRVKQIAFREGLTETKAKLRIQAMEEEREFLRQLYEKKHKRTPAFNILYDCSEFTLSQIARQIALAAKLKKLV